MTTRSPRATAFVALWRGINVGGNKKVPMAELRGLTAMPAARQAM